MLHTVNSSMMVVVGPNFHLVTTPSLSELPEAKDMDIEIQVLKDQDLPNHTVNGDGECSWKFIQYHPLSYMWPTVQCHTLKICIFKFAS